MGDPGNDLTKIRDDIATLAPQGQGPDLFVGQSDWVGRLADYGLLAPIDLTSVAKSFRPVSVSGFTYQARTYGVPFATENLALFRNTDLTPETPESIDVMARDGLELKDKNDQILPIALPVGPQGDAYQRYPFYSAAGGKIFDLDTQGGTRPTSWRWASRAASRRPSGSRSWPTTARWTRTRPLPTPSPRSPPAGRHT